MVKPYILIMLSVALSFSMITPTLNSLFGLESDTSVLVDFSEEEPNKGEKEIYEKDTVFVMDHKFEPYCPIQFARRVGFYKEGASMFDKKVLLPPPKQTS